MTADVSPPPAEKPANSPPSTAGMTTKVVKGSLWTLAGQVAPLLVGMISTPFVIRLLGVESYGALILVGLVPSYLGFADLGMGLASTKFASEAYSQNDFEQEAIIVRTSAMVSFIATLPLGACIFLFARPLVVWLSVPQILEGEVELSLRIAAATFVLNFLNNVFNTPQLSRLRMDLNTLVNSGFRILGLIATPIVIYLGGGIVNAVLVLFLASALTCLSHILVSSKLNPALLRGSVDRGLIPKLLRFGAPLGLSGIATVVLFNLEKAVLAATVSVEALAYYSVAFTLAMTASLFAAAMIQSLIPAFSQLSTPSRWEELEALFTRCVFFNIVCLVPSTVFLSIIARPFFTVWAGESFGQNSTLPFMILLLGLMVNIPAYVSYSLLVATGRTSAVARVYWIEIAPYVALVFYLTRNYGAIGAATAWSLRVICDGLVFFWLAKFQPLGRLRLFRTGIIRFGSLPLLFIPSIIMLILMPGRELLVLIPFSISAIVYCVLIWRVFIEPEEKIWAMSLFSRYFFN